MSFAQFILKKVDNGSAAEAEVLERRKSEGRAGLPKAAPRKRGPKTKWTPERDERLKNLAKRYTGPEIAEKMGVTYCAIRTRASRIDVNLIGHRGKYHEWTHEEVELVKIMREKGYTSAEIGKVLKVSDIQVRGTIHRMKLPALRKKWSLEMEYAVAVYYKEKDSTILEFVLKTKKSSLHSRYGRLSAMRRLSHLRGLKNVKDLVAEYCEKKGVALPARNS